MYDAEKFKEFDKAVAVCAEKDANMIIAYPHILGDNYEEMIENLGKLADAGVPLSVVSRILEEN